MALPALLFGYSAGCFTTSSPAATGSGGAGGAVASTSTGGSAGSDLGGGGSGSSNPCANVTCPQGYICDNGTNGPAADAGSCIIPPSCAAGNDCGQCADFGSCVTCYSLAFPPEALQELNALRSCVSCSACYGSCDGADLMALSGSGQACSSAPASTDKCDIPAQGCSSCSTCATAATGSCSDQEAACNADANCGKLTTIITACPAPTSSSDGGAGDSGIVDAATD